MSGVMKHAERLEEVARQVVLESKACRVCEFHDVLIRENDPDAESHAYALATNMWKRGEVGGEREDVCEAVKDELVNAADEDCPECERFMNED